MAHVMDKWIEKQWMGRFVKQIDSGRMSKVVETLWDEKGALHIRTEDGYWSPAVNLLPRRLYLSFEQSAVLFPDGELDLGYVTVADGDLYDGPGAKDVGNILATVGPFPMTYGEEAVKQVYEVLKLTGADVQLPN